MRNRTAWLLVASVAGCLGGPVAREASAGEFSGRVIRTLREFGFRLDYEDRGGTFPGGIAGSATAIYTGQELDFGMVSLALTGGMQFSFEAANRLGPSAEFAVSTLGQPLGYTLDINTGAQDYRTSGAILIDASTEFNPLGFYDLRIFASNRGGYDADGFLIEDSDVTDFDVGPINISGNVFLDGLAVITQPFFDVTGQPNPLSKLSGRASRQAILGETVDGLKGKVQAGEDLTERDMAKLVDATVAAALFGLEMPDLAFLSEADLAGLTSDQAAFAAVPAVGKPERVPESTPLLLLGSATVCLALRRKPQT